MSSSPTQILARRLLRLANRLQRSMTTVMEAQPGSLTDRQAQVLRALGASTRMKDLTEAMQITPAVVTGIVDRLERQGLVRRRPSGTDRRVVVVELTAAGTVARDEAADVMTEALCAALAELTTADELAVVADTLATLERLIERRRAAGSRSPADG